MRRALIVDRAALAGYQETNDALMASETLKAGFRTDVEPILAMARLETGGAIDPVATFRRRRLPGEGGERTAGGWQAAAAASSDTAEEKFSAPLAFRKTAARLNRDRMRLSKGASYGH